MKMKGRVCFSFYFPHSLGPNLTPFIWNDSSTIYHPLNYFEKYYHSLNHLRVCR